MDLNIIDTLMERMEIRKKMITGNKNTEEWCRVVNVLNSNHQGSLEGYFNMLTEEQQLEIMRLMMERPYRYVVEITHWETLMTDWQLSAVRIVA